MFPTGEPLAPQGVSVVALTIGAMRLGAISFSASHGSYLLYDAKDILPSGLDHGALPNPYLGSTYTQSITIEFCQEKWYETSVSGDLRSLSWYRQAHWKAAAEIQLGTHFG